MVNSSMSFFILSLDLMFQPQTQPISPLFHHLGLKMVQKTFLYIVNLSKVPELFKFNKHLGLGKSLNCFKFKNIGS